MPRPSISESTPPRTVAASPANATAAALLDQIADDLEQEQPRPARRIAAYRQAAASLRETHLRLEELWHGGGDRAITEIPKVTPAIARVVGDLIATKAVALPRPAPPRSRTAPR